MKDTIILIFHPKFEWLNLAYFKVKLFQDEKKTIPVQCKDNRQVRAKLQQILSKYFPDFYIMI